ncbi:MAG: hypothetical protein HY515_03980 [Candidatus Aenigmarchaeota archaeon]|nr:hypothetical protein [Candidatus Aenigmarchaeota archaeon]
MKFFSVWFGLANKYYWFTVVEEVDKSTPKFVEVIKSGRFTFTKQSGTTAADMHGSTLALDFFSQRFVDFLKKAGVKNFDAFKLKFAKELSRIGNYYYLEPKDKLPEKKIKKEPLDISTFSLKDWKGQDLFSLKRTNWIFISERLKNLIEKQNFKNIRFREVIPIL